MILFNNNTFHLSTKNSSYIMEILSDGVLRHCYYGRRISNENMDHYNLYTACGYDYTAPYTINDKITTMDALSQECPSCGRGDYRSPAVVIENEDGRRVNDYKYSSHSIYQGASKLKGLPHLDTDTNEVQTLEIVMIDLVSNANVHLFYSVFEDSDIIARHIEVRNNTEKSIKVCNIMSLSLDFEECDFEMLSLYGRWANERTYERYSLHHGKSVISSKRGSIGHQTCPFAALVRNNTDESFGEAYGVTLIYSGNFEIGAEVGQFDNIRLFAGINREDFSWELEKGECFVSPQALLTYSHEGLGKMSQNFHNICRKHLGACAAPKKHPIVLNLWEAFYFNVTEQDVLRTIDAAHDFGVDTLVLDDGWFGKRESELTSLGDWYINTDKFPGGFDKIINCCKENGLKFGLWFEPEVISPESELFKKHPDWCIHIDGLSPIKSRSEYVLDLSRAEVVDAVYDMISDVLRKNDISYLKWDMNRNITDGGSYTLDADNQGEHSHRYILGVYDLMRRFKEEFPDVFFEGSAGGGGRMDFGILYYMPQIWASDNTDAIGRLSIQYGTSMLFPPEAISCHVSQCPNHQTGRTTPFETRGNVAQLFSFGYELDPNNLSAELKELLKIQIAKHREYETWLGEALFYRLKDPSKSRACAWQSVSADKTLSAVIYVTKFTSPKNIGEYLRLKGLDGNKKYKVMPLDIVASGDTLMYAGLPIKEQYHDFDSLLFELSEVKE